MQQLDAPHPTPAKPRAKPRKSRWENSSAQDLDLEETVQRRVEQCLWQFPLLESFTLQKDSFSGDEPVVKRTKRNLKSVGDCTG